MLEALRESEERFALFLKHLPGVAFINDSEGRVLYANETYERVVGRESEELVGHKNDEIFPSEVASRFAEQDEAVRTEERTLVFVETVPDTTGPRDWLTSKFPIYQDGRATLVGGVAIDITERKRAQERLTETAEQLEHLLKTGPLAIYRCEPSADYPATFVSENVKDQLGYEAHEFTDDPRFWKRHIHPDDAPRVLSEIPRLLERGHHTHEYRFLHKDGSYRWMLDELRLTRDAEGNPRDIIGSWVDITERKLMEEALRKTTRRLSRAQSVARMGFLEWNLKTNEMYWSDQIYDLFGIDRQEQKASIDLAMELVHPDDREFVEKNLEAATNSVKGFDIDHRMVRADGNVMWVHGQAELVRDADGTPGSLLGTVVDISDRKRAEQERERLEDQLRQAQKMEAVGQLAGGVAHDFNNILTVVLGNAELLLSMADRDPDEHFTNVVKSGLERIKFAGHRAAALTRQLLAFGQREMASVEVLDLGPLIRDAGKLVRQLLREDIVFDVDVASDTRRIRADAGQFEQVMMNLVVNARDAMPKGGTLSVTCANADLDEAHAAAHIGARPGPHVMLAVSDPGIGMSNETMERMFEPFFTTKPTGKGAGLGLTTVYEIVKQAGAHISVESELDKGSTFTVYFPASEEEVAKPETAASLDEQGGDEVILVCEDEEDVLRVACQVLRAGGYTVLEAVNGKHALDVAADYDGKIDLLLSDVVMPEMNGKDLAEAMAGSYPEMRVLFVSGYTGDVLGSEVSRSEGKDFLQKPFSPTVLLKRVRELLDET